MPPNDEVVTLGGNVSGLQGAMAAANNLFQIYGRTIDRVTDASVRYNLQAGKFQVTVGRLTSEGRRFTETYTNMATGLERVAQTMGRISAQRTFTQGLFTGARSGIHTGGIVRGGIAGAFSAGGLEGATTSSILGGALGGAGVGATVAAVNGLGIAIKFTGDQMVKATVDAIAFEKQIALIRTLSADAQLSMNEWSDGIIKLSNDFARPRADVAEGLYELLSSQVSKGAESFNVLNEALKLATVLNVPTVDAVKAITAAINSYRLSSRDAAEVSGLFFQAVDLGNFRLNELAGGIGRLTQVGNILGVSLKENLAALSALTNAGLNQDEAITLLINLYNALLEPNEKLRRVMKQWGVETAQQVFQSKSLFAVLNDLNVATKGNANEIAALFPDMRGLRAELFFAAGGAETAAQFFDKMSNSAGNLNDRLAEFKDRAGFDAEGQFNRLSNALVTFGQAFLETIGHIAAPKTDEALSKLEEFAADAKSLSSILNDPTSFLFGQVPADRLVKPTDNIPPVPTGFGPRGEVLSGKEVEKQFAERQKLLDQKELEDQNKALKEVVDLFEGDFSRLADDARKKLFAVAEAERDLQAATQDVLRGDLEARVQNIQRINSEYDKLIKDVRTKEATLKRDRIESNKALLGQLQFEGKDPFLRRFAEGSLGQPFETTESRKRELRKEIKGDKDPEELKRDFNELRGLINEQIKIATDKFNRTGDRRDLDEVVARQNELNKSKKEELEAEKGLAALSTSRRAETKALADEISRLNKLKPEDGLERFDAVAKTITERFKSLSPDQLKAAEDDIGKLRQGFSKQVEERKLLDQLADGQQKLKTAAEELRKAGVDAAISISRSFEDARGQIVETIRLMEEFTARQNGGSVTTPPVGAPGRDAGFASAPRTLSFEDFSKTYKPPPIVININGAEDPTETGRKVSDALNRALREGTVRLDQGRNQ